jgi:hypothetical protein
VVSVKEKSRLRIVAGVGQGDDGTREPIAPILREKFKWRPQENESTDAGQGGAVARRSDEGSVMALEQRGYIVSLYLLVNQ